MEHTDTANWMPPRLIVAIEGKRAARRQARARTECAGADKLHLGAGPHVMAGWANLDVREAPGIIACDLSRPLPVRSDSIQFIFCEHFVEHLTREQGRNLFAECSRVLRSKGVFRISTPDLGTVVQMYNENRLDMWAPVGFSPPNRCQMVNDGLRWWDHQHVYDLEDISSLLKECRFAAVERVQWRRSDHALLRDLEKRPFCGDLIVEATKS